ncbi:restriction endonuclease subunit S [Labilibaculum sp.]|uniref:restriction endonuclease subunit S n=1 Tax=Labilibaculum sp. TaxID=2060723 RepID=UPI00356A2113
MEKVLPKGWVGTDLDTVVSRMTNGSGLKQLEEPYEGSFPITRIETIWNETIDLTRVKYVSPTEEEIEKYKLLKGDVLFSHINSDKHLGKTAVFNLEETVLHGINLLLLRSCPQYDGYFLNYLLRHYRFSGRFIEVAQRSVNQSSINQKKLKSFQVPLPPLTEQKRIVAKLDSLFASLESTKTRLDKIPLLLKNFKQAILTQAVTGKLTEQWREGKELEAADLTSVQNKRLEDYYILKKNNKKVGSKAPIKPEYLNQSLDNIDDYQIESWYKAPVGLLCDCIVPGRDKPKSFTGDIPWITTPDLVSDRINSRNARLFLSSDEILEVKAKLIPEKSVVISIVGRFGVSCIVEDKCVINQQLHAFLPSELILPSYLMYYFKTQEEVMNSISTSTTIAYINKTKANGIIVNVPTLNEQTEIVHRVESLFAKADAIEAQYTKLKQKIDTLPQAILAKAFRGELVEQNPLDEPASVLLERIKQLKLEAAKKPKKKVVRKKKADNDLLIAAEPKAKYN